MAFIMWNSRQVESVVPSMSYSLESIQQSRQNIYDFAMSLLDEDVVAVVPQVGGGATHQPRLIQLHPQRHTFQERIGGTLRQEADPVTARREMNIEDEKLCQSSVFKMYL